MKKAKQPKLSKCRERAKGCFLEGYHWTSNIQMQRCCRNPNCVLQRTIANREKAELKKAKAERSKTKEQKQAAKTVRQILAESQTYCNRAILLRDKGQPCISCGNINDVKYDAGHLIHVGSDPHSPIRFHPFNLNRQCSCNCNQNLSGNAIEYRKGLIEKIGAANVEWLAGSHDAYRYTREDALEIKAHFMELCRYLQKIS